MKKLFGALAIIAITASCSSNDKGTVVSVEHHNTSSTKEKVEVTQTMNVEVSGMSCVHACGGAIRTNLKDTKAVDRVSFDFEDGRKVNTCTITYDDKKISEKEIIRIIEKINEKQFKTGKHSSEPIKA